MCFFNLIPSLSANSLKNSLKRFISRRGCPDNVISDNDSNFVAIETQNFASNLNIKWHFNLALAPWQGGFFERLVRRVKELMKKHLQNYKITLVELQTILLEIDLIINNRPDTHIYTESTELPLTPSQLVFSRNLNYSSLPESPVNVEIDIYEHREKLTNIIHHFWHRWRTEYVTNLCEYQKLRSLNNNSPYIKVNDVLLIHDDNAPRHLWRIVRVIELIKSKSDNEVRGALVKVPRTGRTVPRPINKLIPIDCIESHLQSKRLYNLLVEMQPSLES